MSTFTVQPGDTVYFAAGGNFAGISFLATPQPPTPNPDVSVVQPYIPDGTKLASAQSLWYNPLPADNSCRLTGTAKDNWGDAWNGAGWHTESALLAEFRRHVYAASPQANWNNYAVVDLVVPAGQATHAVAVQNATGQLAADMAAVPIPSNAVPAQGENKLSLWQPSTDKLWEFWGYGWYGNYTAGWGGFQANVSKSRGAYTVRGQSQGAAASGLFYAPGQMQWDEWTKHHTFNHALFLGVYGGTRSFWYPAWRNDGSYDPNNLIPAGTMFRINPAFNIDAMSPALSPFARAMAHAIQTYGMIVGDGSGVVTMMLEDISENPGSPGAWWDGVNGVGYGGSGANNGTIMYELFRDNTPTGAQIFPQIQVVDPAWLQAQGR